MSEFAAFSISHRLDRVVEFLTKVREEFGNNDGNVKITHLVFDARLTSYVVFIDCIGDLREEADDAEQDAETMADDDNHIHAAEYSNRAASLRARASTLETALAQHTAQRAGDLDLIASLNEQLSAMTASHTQLVDDNARLKCDASKFRFIQANERNIDELMRAPQLAAREQDAQRVEWCVWEIEAGDSEYKSSCGQTFSFAEDGVEDNGFQFCFSCGKRIEEIDLALDTARHGEDGK